MTETPSSGTRRGLYVHVPFCRKKCHYCHFVITTKRDAEFRERFFQALESEIRHIRSHYGPLVFDTLYFGGGTPSSLTAEEMKRLIHVLRQTFTFHEDMEWTCEMNPEDRDADKLQAFRALGMNRISLGAQTFNDALLKDLGREHTAQDVVNAVQLLKQTGFPNISLDLMLRLPGQTLEHVKDSLQQAVDLGVSQISFYDLEVHAQSVFGARQRRGTLDLPDEAVHYAMFADAENFLSRQGYEPYEVSNFAKSGFESRHNLIYWHNQEYLGLGPGAFSYLRGVRYQFAMDVTRYIQKCGADDWSRDTEDVITERQKEIETLLTGLRLKQGIHLSGFPIISRDIEVSVKHLLQLGMITQDADCVKLTQKGRCLFEKVALEIIP